MGALALRTHKPSARSITPHLPSSRPQDSELEGKEEKEAGESISSSSCPFYEATGLRSNGWGLRGQRVFQAWRYHLKDSLVPLKCLPLHADRRVAAAWRLRLPAALCLPALRDSTAPPAGGCLAPSLTPRSPRWTAALLSSSCHLSGAAFGATQQAGMGRSTPTSFLVLL